MFAVQGKLKERGTWALCLDEDDRPEVYIDKQTAKATKELHEIRHTHTVYRVVKVDVVVQPYTEQ